ncbi:hypothetical protein GG851_21590 [Bordetella petrii]|nr:hypothetical protein [Bordetella petrii]
MYSSGWPFCPARQVLLNIAVFLTLRAAARPARGWFTIAPMLQDLDQLAARIGQLVQRTRQLHAERDALRVRLNQSESSQRALEQRCAEREAEIQALQTKLQEHDGTVSTVLAEARQTEADLREQLARAAADRDTLETRFGAREAELQGSLHARDTDLQRLRVATAAARERIDTVLARLPGAPTGEQP